MDYINAILLGIIEGITEFLPISSTGHLLIAEQWLGARSDTFNVVIQAGAILAVTFIYWQRILSLVLGFNDPKNRDYLLKLIAAFLITAVLGPRGHQARLQAAHLGHADRLGAHHRRHLDDRGRADRRPSPRKHEGYLARRDYRRSRADCRRHFPGTSRSGATIFAAMLFGTGNRAAATEFAFLVGIPTMYAASGYELLKTLKAAKLENAPPENWTLLGIAFVVSMITAFVSVKWLLGYIRSTVHGVCDLPHHSRRRAVWHARPRLGCLRSRTSVLTKHRRFPVCCRGLNHLTQQIRIGDGDAALGSSC